MRLSRRQFTFTSLAAAASLHAPGLRAAGYPERPLIFICPWSAGGTVRAAPPPAATGIGGKVAGRAGSMT